MKTKKNHISHLYDLLGKSLDKHPNSERTLALANQLETALSESGDEDTGAIFGKECRSLVSEARGNLQEAIRHREDEIRLIHRLHKISCDTPAESFVFSQYGYRDLYDSLGLLAVLYHESGNVEKAVQILTEARQICLDHGIEFDAEDILREYTLEKAGAHGSCNPRRRKANKP